MGTRILRRKDLVKPTGMNVPMIAHTIPNLTESPSFVNLAAQGVQFYTMDVLSKQLKRS